MASNITLHKGLSSSKLNDYYTAIMSPVAFLSDHYAGVYMTDGAELNIFSPETSHRGVLAAIRGSLLAQALSYVSPEFLNSCFCACVSDPSPAQRSYAGLVKNSLPEKIVREARFFVPNNIVQILSNLAERDILFDGREIEIEINSKLIKKSSDLENILLKNKINCTDVDMEEYGYEINLEEMKDQMDLDINEHAVLGPFLDEYMARCNKSLMRIATYVTSNTIGFCILSKMKRHKDVDFEFVVTFRSEYYGPVEHITSDAGISPIIKFRRSSEKVKMEFFSAEMLKKCYGKEFKPQIEHKLPFVYRPDGASMYLEGLNVLTKVSDFELAKIAHPVFNNVRSKFMYIQNYGVSSIN